MSELLNGHCPTPPTQFTYTKWNIMQHQLDLHVYEKFSELALLGKSDEAVKLICDWWNAKALTSYKASHFGIFAPKSRDIYQSLTPDDPDERHAAELLTSSFNVKLGTAVIEFRYDTVENGIRYTYNMDNESIDCAAVCLETYRWWNAKAVTAWASLAA
jgi:hypothetical protein